VQYRYYAPNCVMYRTSRSFQGKVIFAVCGDRSPLSVSDAGFRMDEYGLENSFPPDTVDGKPMVNGLRIPIGRIKAVVKKAPAFDPDFIYHFTKYSRHIDGTEFHVPEDAETQNERESTLLHDVVANGDFTRVLFLLSSGLHPDVRGPGSVTPLMIATFEDKMQNSAIVAALLSAGADPDAQSKTGMTALMFAVRGGSKNAAILLKNAGADTTLLNRSGQRAGEMKPAQ
jgi:hypothetical protein